jgi:hypothetical protein
MPEQVPQDDPIQLPFLGLGHPCPKKIGISFNALLTFVPHLSFVSVRKSAPLKITQRSGILGGYVFF